MSYLMDALRKAERERNVGRVPDAVRSEYAEGYSVPQRGIHWLPLLLTALVLLNLLLLAVFWLSQRGAEEEPAAQPVEGQVANSTPAAVKTPSPAQKPQPSAAAVEQPPAVVERPSATVFNSQPEPDLLMPDTQEEFASQPVPSLSSLQPAIRRGIPELVISGHLFSTVPGRSFVLINGRRYNEGQRTDEGPAVMYIDEKGAVLNHDGLRFRVDAPR